ncbi:hypothetical protein EDD85DRAFT_942434 [Armillaria nabsnona]|nr:hypothetical protein EDD85DRAFT_942434 [Armillaria nabsnona]
MVICCTLLPTFVFQLLHEIVTGSSGHGSIDGLGDYKDSASPSPIVSSVHMLARTRKVTGVILLMVTGVVLESKIRGSLPTSDSGYLPAGLFPLLEVPPLLKRLRGRYVDLLISRFRRARIQPLSSICGIVTCSAEPYRVSGPPAAAHPRPRSGSWRACGSGSSSNKRSRDLSLESAAGAAHDQGRGVSSGRGAGSDSGSVVGRRQHWKTGATVVPTITHCQTVCLGVGLCYAPKQCRMLGHLGPGCFVLTAYWDSRGQQCKDEQFEGTDLQSACRLVYILHLRSLMSGVKFNLTAESQFI